MASIRLRVEPQTWQAFQMTALEQHSGADVAAKLGMRITSVYKAQQRSKDVAGRNSALGGGVRCRPRALLTNYSPDF